MNERDQRGFAQETFTRSGRIIGAGVLLLVLAACANSTVATTAQPRSAPSGTTSASTGAAVAASTPATTSALTGAARSTSEPATTSTEIAQELAALRDRQAIIDTVNAVGIYADFDEWDQVQAQFAEEVVLDYTSYAQAAAGTDAGTPDTLTPTDVVAAWQTVLPGYDHTQHVIGNHQVTLNGDEATVVSTVHATHYLAGAEGGDSWIFIGDYTHHLLRTEDGWKIDRMQANLRAQLGNPNLPALATQRVQERAAMPTP